MYNLKKFCYKCDGDVNINIVTKSVKMEIKGVEIDFIGKIAYCKECGEEIYVESLEEENIKIGNEQYREKIGIIQISEIQEILDKYDIGQKPLSKLLGWSEATILRYTKGLTPSKEYSGRLKELKNPYKMLEMLKKNGAQLTPIARKKLEDRIKSIIDVKANISKNKNIDSIYISRYFLSRVDVEAGDFISHLKLQKLVYYAQAWSLAFLDKLLFNEDFEAWIHGPVIPALYNVYRDFGKAPLPKVDLLEKDAFKDDEMFILEGIWIVYGKYNAKYLEALTHREDPWKIARGNCKEDERCNNILTKKSIRSYYTSVKSSLGIDTTDDLNSYVSNIKIKI